MNSGSKEASNEEILIKTALLPSIIVALACTIIFSVISGRQGLMGALVAQVVVVIFFLVTLLVSKLSHSLDPMATMALALFSYVTKLTAIGAFLIILSRFTPRDAIDRTAFGVSALAATGAWLSGEIKGYLSLKTHLPLPPKHVEDRPSEESQ